MCMCVLVLLLSGTQSAIGLQFIERSHSAWETRRGEGRLESLSCLKSLARTTTRRRRLHRLLLLASA